MSTLQPSEQEAILTVFPAHAYSNRKCVKITGDRCFGSLSLECRTCKYVQMAAFDPKNPLKRPSTPQSTAWFEFLLDDSLLEKHLAGNNPGRNNMRAIIQDAEQYNTKRLVCQNILTTYC